MSKLNLSIATTDYDHFRDFRVGEVRAEGIEANWSLLGHHEVFARFTANWEWDVAELSFAKFMAQITRDDCDIIGLPIVYSRLFRFSSFYINKNSDIRSVEDLKGKRVWSPEWAHSAAVYMRGWTHNERGVKLNEVHWYQAGANAPGRVEKVKLNLPDGVQLTRVADKSLSEMLSAGEIDCAIIAWPPNCFLQGHRDVECLYNDHVPMEQEYFARTGVWPIMHIIAVQRHIVDENRWVARNLFNAFDEAKCRSVQRMLDPAVSRYPLPFVPPYARRMQAMFGNDPFPFGVEQNRPTWEQMLLYTYQQGIASKHLTPEDIFPEGIMTNVVV